MSTESLSNDRPTAESGASSSSSAEGARRPSGSERTRRAFELVEAALELAGDRRRTFLDGACAGDSGLRREVDSLLDVAPSAPFLDVSAEDRAGARPSGASGSGLADFVGELLARRPELERALEGETRAGAATAGAGPDEAGAPSGPPLDPPTLEELAAVQRAADRYAGREEVGRGGMGVVYRVWDAALRRSLAMKVIEDARRQDPGSRGDAVNRFLREAQVTGQLDHPGVVPLHELGIDADGRPFFTMRLVAGTDLGDVIRLAKEGKDGWSLTRVAGILVKVLETLAYAHAKGVIHRDLKPQNIMVGQYGETYVMDWGLAKLVGAADHRDLRPREELDEVDELELNPAAPAGDPRRPSSASPLLTMDGAVLGTPSFMPPEQASGRADELDGRSDVYSVGAILYTLIAGLAPFAERERSRSPRSVLRALRRGPPRPLHELSPGAPAELVAICEKAMARSPGERYASAADMAEDLKCYLENRVVRAYRTGAVAELEKWVSRNRATAASLAAVLVLTVGALGVILALQVKAKNDIAVEQASTQAALTEKGRALERAEGLRALATARATLADHPAHALRLAVEAARREPGLLANNVLLEAMEHAREVRTIQPPGGSPCAALSPEGTRIATGHADGTVWIWDAESGRPSLVLLGPEQAIKSVSFHPQGKVVQAASLDGTVWLWQAETGIPVRTWRCGSNPVNFAAFSPDGSRVAAALEDATARIWNAETGEELAVLHGHRFRVRSTSFDGRGERLVTTSDDDTCRVWEATSGRELVQLEGPIHLLHAAAFHPREDIVVTAALEPTIALWDAASGRRRSVLAGHSGAVATVAISHDGRWLLSGGYDSTARLWDISRIEDPREALVLRGHRGRLTRCQLDASSHSALSCAEDGSVRLWNVRLRPEPGALAPQPAWAPGRAFTPDGARLVLPQGQVARVLDVASGDTVALLDGKAGWIDSATFDPSGLRVVTGAFTGVAQVWDAGTGAELQRLAGHRSGVTRAEFSPGGERIVTASRDMTACVWDLASLEAIVTLRGHANWLGAATFSPDGRRIATASSDGTARVWDAGSGRELRRLAGHTGMVRHVAYSADGRLVITGSYDRTARVWEAETGKLVATLSGHHGDVHWGALNADATRAITCSRDGTARLWLLADGSQQAMVRAAAGDFVQVVFGGDEQRIFALEADGRPRTWPVDPLTADLATAPRGPSWDGGPEPQLDSSEQLRRFQQEWDGKRLRETLELAAQARAARPAEPGVHDYYYRALDARVQALAASQATAEVEKVLADLRREAEGTDDSKLLTWIAHIQERAGALADAVRTLERVVREPGSPEHVAARLERCRSLARPDLLTCASIDAALEAADQARLVAAGERWRFLRGTREPSPGLEWTSSTFDDSAWEEGPSGFGYGNDRDATVLGDMAGSYTTLHVRRAFEPAESLEIDRLVLSVRSDDGFVAWLNGVEVARTRAGKAGKLVTFDATATGPAPEPFVPEVIEIPASLLVPGRNVIALVGLNRTLTNADFLLAPALACRLKPREERYRHAIAGLQAPARRAYAEGAMLQRLGRHEAALERLEAAAALDPAPVELWLRIAECLAALGRKEEAASRLGNELSRGAEVDRRPRNLWWRLQVVELARSAGEVRDQLSPPESEGSGPGEDLRWLLEGLLAGRALRINAGGDEARDEDGAVWSRDRFFLGGRRAAGKPGSAPPHQDAREFPAGGLRPPGYSIPLPPGRYTVMIHFADFDPGAAGWRIFDLRLEGSAVLEGYQPGALQRAMSRGLGPLAAPRHVIEPRRFEVQVKDGFLDVELVPVGAPAAVSAIEVTARG